MFGGGAFLGSSAFIFCFNSASFLGSAICFQPRSTVGFSIFSLTVLGATGDEGFCNTWGEATIILSPWTFTTCFVLTALFGSTFGVSSTVICWMGRDEYRFTML